MRLCRWVRAGEESRAAVVPAGPAVGFPDAGDGDGAWAFRGGGGGGLLDDVDAVGREDVVAGVDVEEVAAGLGEVVEFEDGAAADEGGVFGGGGGDEGRVAGGGEGVGVREEGGG